MLRTKNTKSKNMFSIAHFHFSKNRINLWKCLPFQSHNTQNSEEFHQNIFWLLTNIFIHKSYAACLSTKLYVLQYKSIERLIKNISVICIRKTNIIPSPPRLVVLSFDDDIRLQRQFVTNISHNCPRLSYTNKQIEHQSMFLQETSHIV